LAPLQWKREALKQMYCLPGFSEEELTSVVSIFPGEEDEGTGSARKHLALVSRSDT